MTSILTQIVMERLRKSLIARQIQRLCVIIHAQSVTREGTPDMPKTIALVAAASPTPEPAPRPYWQDRPCPHWCLMSVPHEDSDMPADRYHMSVIYHVDLALEDASTFYSADGRLLSCAPAFLTASLHQHNSWRDPQVVLCRNGKVDIPFTIAEAGTLAQALAAHAAMDPARGGECPHWCHGPHTESYVIDRIHVSDYTNVTLALGQHDDRQQPEPIAVRLWQGWLERDPSVDILYRDEYTSLTFAEARELAEGLSSLATDAKVGGGLAAVA
jgi:hypothetical protein